MVFLDLIVPHMISSIKSPSTQRNLRELLFQQLSTLVTTVRQHVGPFVEEIFEISTEYWSEHLVGCLSLVEKLASRVPDDFKDHLPT